MRKIKIVFYLILFLIAIIACEKQSTVVNNVVYDTIKPQPYFPVYPGSYWDYLVNGYVNLRDTMAKQYLPHSYLSYEGYTDTVFVPFLNGAPIYGYNKIEWLEAPFGNCYTKWTILSETVGTKFTRNWEDTRFGDFSEHLVVAEKKQVGNDSIIVVKGHWILGPNISRTSYQEFKKDVGLIKHFVVDTVLNDTIYKKVLINYVINN